MTRSDLRGGEESSYTQGLIFQAETCELLTFLPQISLL